jgi:outer membrane immunogenic protein
MKKLFLAAVAIVALTGSSADAADLRGPAIKAPPPLARPACAQFGGFYLGINGGWAYHDTNWVDRDAWVDQFDTDWALGSASSTRDGGTVGGQIGYNWQRNCTLFGIEIDANWADLKGSKFHSPNDIVANTDLTLTQKVHWFGTIRTRTGLIVDNMLLYVTGGAAFANIKHAWTMDDSDAGTPIESFSSKKGRWGWVGGVGAEWAWTPNVSIKSEVLYIRFQEETTSVFSAAADRIVTFDHQDSMWVARVGLNVKLGAPVQAAY